MDALTANDLLDSFRSGFQPPYSGSVYQWANECIELPPNYAINGRFDVSVSPYLVAPFNDLLNSTVKQINLVGATQTGKTLVSELFLPYIIVNDPGPVLKIHQNEDMARTFTETRLIPLLKNCSAVKSLLESDRFSAKKGGVILPHMACKISGPSENFLHGLSIRYLLLDEAWLYDSDVIKKAKARTTAFAHNSKILISSQPGVEGDQLTQEINAGLVYNWGWRCPHCNRLQLWFWNKQTEDGKDWAGIVWDKVKREDDETDIEKTAATVRLVCVHCKHELQDTDSNRRLLNDTGEYVLTKSNGNPEIKTYQWPAFVNTRLSFRSKVMQYLEAKSIERNQGRKDAIKIFYQQVLGQVWKNTVTLEPSKILVETYNPAAPWPEEVTRFLTVDYQQKNGIKFYVVRAWAKNGESRLINYGYVTSWQEIEEIRKRYGVPIPNVGIDTGYHATEVYAESIKHGEIVTLGKTKLWVGWTCLKGDGKEYYLHKDGVRRYYSQEVEGDCQFPTGSKFKGLNARLYLWSNLSVKTTLIHLRDGKGAAKWATNVKDSEYESQLYSESLEDVLDKRTNLMVKRWVKKTDNNHYFDCECMNLLMAMMFGCFASVPATEDKPQTI